MNVIIYVFTEFRKPTCDPPGHILREGFAISIFYINLYFGGKSQIATYDLFVRVKPSTNLASTALYCSHFSVDIPYAHLAPAIQTTSNFLLVFLLVSVIV